MTQTCLSKARLMLPFVTPILMLVRSSKGGEIVWRRRATLLCARTKQSRHEQDTRHQPLRYLPRLIGKVVIGQSPRMILLSIVLVIGGTLSSSQEVLRAQEVDKPAIPPQPRTINLTQEQRFVIRENVKDLTLSKASKDAPETIGDPVPPDIVLHALPSEVGVKVSQVRSHMFSSRKVITPSCWSVPTIVE